MDPQHINLLVVSAIIISSNVSRIAVVTEGNLSEAKWNRLFAVMYRFLGHDNV